MDDTFLLDDLLGETFAGDEKLLQESFPPLDPSMLMQSAVSTSDDAAMLHTVFDSMKPEMMDMPHVMFDPMVGAMKVPVAVPQVAAQPVSLPQQAVPAATSKAADAAMAKQRRKMRRQSMNAARKTTQPKPAAASGTANGKKALTPKELERKRRNRESAALSRKRKREYTQQLEREVAELTRQNQQLSGYVAELASSNQELKKQLAAMEQMLVQTPEEREALEREIAAETARTKAQMKSDMFATPLVAAPAPAPALKPRAASAAHHQALVSS